MSDNHVSAAETVPRRNRYERDVTRIFTEVGLYEAAPHGYRFRFRVVERDGSHGKYRLLLPLRLEEVHFREDDGSMVIDREVYDRREDTRLLFIPLSRLTGRGDAFPPRPEGGDNETHFLLGLFERVTLAGMAWSVREFIDD